MNKFLCRVKFQLVKVAKIAWQSSLLLAQKESAIFTVYNKTKEDGGDKIRHLCKVGWAMQDFWLVVVENL